jgi:hypothetical protein
VASGTQDLELIARDALLVTAAAVVVAAAVVAGIVVFGSPATQRLRRLDGVRIQDLEQIERLATAYAKVHKGLPADLSALKREPGYLVPRGDPVTGKPYEYQVSGAESFRLCATFATRSSSDDSFYTGRHYPAATDTWEHAAGRQCFERRAELQ